LGYDTHCVCCDPETGKACPQCGSQNLAYGSYDGGCDSETGYADAGERYRCLDCGSTGDVDDAAPALVMLAQEPRKPIELRCSCPLGENNGAGAQRWTWCARRRRLR
jgi:hypothetical protein